MSMRMSGFTPTAMTLAGVLVAMLWLTPARALAQADRIQPALAVPPDAAVLELDVPPGAEVSIDGVPQGDQRRIEFRPFPEKVAGRYEVKARLLDGREVERSVLLERGWQVRLPLRDLEERPELVVQTGHVTSLMTVAFSPDGHSALHGCLGQDGHPLGPGIGADAEAICGPQ